VIGMDLLLSSLYFSAMIRGIVFVLYLLILNIVLLGLKYNVPSGEGGDEAIWFFLACINASHVSAYLSLCFGISLASYIGCDK
jgi:hypothetical protein